MARYKIRHALATWTSDGVTHTAFRGQVAEIPDEEAKRLLGHEAIIDENEELKHPGILQDLAQSPSDEELVSWITAANASEVKELAASRPELRPRIEGAIERVRSMRGTEDAHLEEVRIALEGLPPHSQDDDLRMEIPGAATGGASDDVSGGGAATGADATDTSGDGADDIVIGGDDPTATGTGPIDHAALVQGSAEDVAAYISAHPDEADAVLAAENANTSDAPRAAVVLAARAAAEFNSGS